MQCSGSRLGCLSEAGGTAVSLNPRQVDVNQDNADDHQSPGNDGQCRLEQRCWNTNNTIRAAQMLSEQRPQRESLRCRAEAD